MEHSSVDIRISWEKHSWSVSIDINTLKDMRSSALKKASAYYFPSLAIWTKKGVEECSQKANCCHLLSSLLLRKIRLLVGLHV